MLLDPELIAAARWLLEALSLGVLVGLILFLVRQYGEAPERVPSHFDYRGRPDRWAGKWVLFVVAAVGVASYVTLSISGGTLRLIAGEAEPKPQEAFLLAWAKLGTLSLLAYAILTMIRVARGQRDRLNLIVLGAIVAAMIVPAILIDTR
jgi:uncharacterized membrane protein